MTAPAHSHDPASHTPPVAAAPPATGHRPWLLTRSGRHLDLLAPQPDQLSLADIALGLENTARYTGQTSRRYSVAEHSLLLARLLPAPLALEALLHDATEAYLGDMTSPLKGLCSGYRAVERRLDLAIRAAWALPAEPDPLVHVADVAIRHLERRVLLPPDVEFDATLAPWPAELIDADAAAAVEQALRGGHEDDHRPGAQARHWQVAVLAAVVRRLPQSAAATQAAMLALATERWD